MNWRLATIFFPLLASLVTAQVDFHPDLPSNKIEDLKNPDELTAEFWNQKAQSVLQAKIDNSSKLNTNRAKNIILFLGDGMSVHTVTATRAFLGDSSMQLSFEKFPYFGLSKTYCVDKRVPDSASTGTAYLSGVKANYGTIGVNAKVKRSNCVTAQNPATHTESIAKWAQDAYKVAGLVTTARVTHASPAGVYAHTADRHWENDAEIIKNGCSPAENVDIARQLIEWPVGKQLRVIMGGGRREFRNSTVNDEEGIPGNRLDGRDLISDWLEDKKLQNAKAQYVWNKKGLRAVNTKKTKYLLGLFSSSHCPYNGDLLRKSSLAKKVPSLSEMTETAIKVLQRHDEGYFLFVEGAKIDIAHHKNRARTSLEETAEFASAIQKARDMTSEEDTLIVVTSDHSHTMTIGGNANRNQDILGLAETKGDDGLPYTILSYANGPGYENTYSKKYGRKDLSRQDVSDPKFKYMATVPLKPETHGGEDVGVFTSGPFAHYFVGNYEQSNIPALMARAAAIGPFAWKSNEIEQNT